MRFTVVLIPDEEGGYTAYVPAIPACVTQGETVPEAIAQAQDAATSLLASYAEHEDEFFTEPAGTVVATIEVGVPAPLGIS